MRLKPRVIVKKLIRRWSISSSARCCDRHALLMISWFTTMSQKNVSDNGSDWCSDTTRRRRLYILGVEGQISHKLTQLKAFDFVSTVVHVHLFYIFECQVARFPQASTHPLHSRFRHNVLTQYAALRYVCMCRSYPD